MSRKSISIAAMMAGAAMVLTPTTAQAIQQDEQMFNLPRQDLGDALRSVAAQAGIELYASARELEGRSTQPLTGRMTAREAIDTLLRGTGLTARYDKGAVIIGGRSGDETPGEAPPEAIIVTGTRIAGAPAAVPVIEVSAEDIRNSGRADLGEVARSLPQNFGGGQNPGIGNSQGAPNENANANGASTFNLRGIGPNATLTLLNGNRFAYTGVSSVIDVSAIPVSAVERIEIVTDGASAILLGFLRRKTGAEEASDLVQEVFVRAAGSRQRGQLVNPGGFLRRIAQNLLIDRARHKRSNDILILPFEEDRDAACAPQQEWQLNADDLLGLYEQAVDAMPFKTRRVFLMHRVDELSYRDIHERLGISIATVEYHMMRALAHIAAALEIER